MNIDIDALIDKITDILVDVGQHDKRFKLGEWIKYSPAEVRKILQEHKNDFEKRYNEEGMTIHGKWTPVEPDTRGCTLKFACSVCDNFTTYYEDAHDCDYDYCPNCGAKMDLEE